MAKQKLIEWEELADALPDLGFYIGACYRVFQKCLIARPDPIILNLNSLRIRRNARWLLRHTVLLALSVYLLAGCAEKYELDLQMEALCKKDGGVKIYETVKLPPEMFDELGQPHFSGDTDFKWLSRGTTRKLGEAYTYIIENTTLKAGDPSKGEGYLGRSHYKIQRNSDKKTLNP